MNATPTGCIPGNQAVQSPLQRQPGRNLLTHACAGLHAFLVPLLAWGFLGTARADDHVFSQAAVGSADGLEITSFLTVYNPTAEVQPYQIVFTGGAGERLASVVGLLSPNGVSTVPFARPGAVVTGELRADAPGASLRYEITVGGQTYEVVSVAASDAVREAVVAAPIEGGSVTSLAVSRDDMSGDPIDLEYLVQGLVQAVGSVTPERQEAGYVSAWVPGAHGFGTLRASSESPFRLLALKTTDGMLTTITTRPGLEAVFPQAFRSSLVGAHGTTRTTVTTTADTNVVIEYYKDDGSLVQRLEEFQEANTSKVYEPSMDGQFYVGYNKVLSDQPVTASQEYEVVTTRAELVSVPANTWTREASVPIVNTDELKGSVAIAAKQDGYVTVIYTPKDGAPVYKKKHVNGHDAWYVTKEFPEAAKGEGLLGFWSNDTDFAVMALLTDKNGNFISQTGTNKVHDENAARTEVFPADASTNTAITDISALHPGFRQPTGKSIITLDEHVDQVVRSQTYWLEPGTHKLNVSNPDYQDVVLLARDGWAPPAQRIGLKDARDIAEGRNYASIVIPESWRGQEKTIVANIIPDFEKYQHVIFGTEHVLTNFDVAFMTGSPTRAFMHPENIEGYLTNEYGEEGQAAIDMLVARTNYLNTISPWNQVHLMPGAFPAALNTTELRAAGGNGNSGAHGPEPYSIGYSRAGIMAANPQVRAADEELLQARAGMNDLIIYVNSVPDVVNLGTVLHNSWENDIPLHRILPEIGYRLAGLKMNLGRDVEQTLP